MLLGEEALKQGIYEAYELASQKLKNFDKLNFLYSLQGNTQKLEKVQKLVGKMNNPMMAFNVALFLNKHEEMEKILRECGFDQLAVLT
jgi:coatomer protein complex subunit alpha (xenin)